jgi:hypothetical protein
VLHEGENWELHLNKRKGKKLKEIIFTLKQTLFILLFFYAMIFIFLGSKIYNMQLKKIYHMHLYFSIE